MADSSRSADGFTRSSQPRQAAWTVGCAVAVGLGAAGFAAAFRSSLSFLYRTAFGQRDLVEVFRGLSPVFRVILPTAGALLVGLLARMASRPGAGGRAGASFGAIMEAAAAPGGATPPEKVHLSLSRTTWRAAASWVALATGGSVGREGALIQFGGSLGGKIAQLAKLPDTATRSIIAAGVAAGFAAAYNTPLAAILFVLEIVTGVVVLEALLPVMIATLVATFATRALVGPGPIYGERAFAIESSRELVAHAALGIVVGLAAVGFMRALALGERMFEASRLPQPFRAAAGGTLVGLVAIGLPEVVGNGFEPLNGMLDGGFPVRLLAVLVVAKIVSTTASVSSGSPGGVFTPSLLVGGGVGLLWGHGVAALLGTSSPVGSYALVGMAAAVAAMTHAPLMAAVLVFELSGDYAIVLPLVLATAIATSIARLLQPDSIYTAERKHHDPAP
jgi:CIC family chloride channel protein